MNVYVTPREGYKVKEVLWRGYNAGDKQYTAEETGQPMDLRVYPGQDATFTLYEDDGTTTRYEQGQCSRIRLHWDDARRTLHINQRQGSYEGMQRKRTFSVTLPGGESKTVKYNGKAKKVQF